MRTPKENAKENAKENMQQLQAKQLAEVIKHNLVILDETSPKYMMETIQLLMSTYMTKYYMLQTGFVPRPEYITETANEKTAQDNKGPELKVL